MLWGGGVHTALAAKSATATIPIVFANGSDPVQFGLVGSLNNPGGNVTGVSFFAATLEEKRLGLLSELVPSARVFGILINPANDNAENQLRDVAQGTLALHRPAVTLKASNDGEIDAAFAAFSQQNVNAVLVASDPFFNGRRHKITELMAHYRLPAIYEWREFVQAGGLASYGSNLSDNYRLGGAYVGRVLGGEKPASLPVVQATKFEFVINLRTAKSLGLSLPSGVLSIVMPSLSRGKMSAIGTKRTSLVATPCPLLGVKRTCLFALQMSANDPKRTLTAQKRPA